MKDLLFEKLSINDSVQDEEKRIYNIIMNQLEQLSWNQDRMGHTLWLTYKETNIVLDEEPIFNLYSNIHVKIYNFETVEQLRELWQDIQIGGNCDLNNKELSIISFALNGVINENYLHNILAHECKHIFHESLYSLSKIVGNLYQKSLSIMEDPNADMKYPKMIKQLAYLIYYFDKVEIDANMESLYKELMHFGNGEKENPQTNVLATFEASKVIYDEIYQSRFNKIFCQIVQDIFGLTLKQILHYIQKRIYYFNAKIKRVVKRYRYDKKLKENMINKMNYLCL